MLGKQNLLNSSYKELSSLVPDNHILKNISKLINFSFIYPIVKKLYANNFGRPSIDPVLFFKMQLIGYIFGIKSDRQLCKEIQLNIAYRWFCKLGINDVVPEHSSLTKTRDRFGIKIYRIIFETLIKKWSKIGIIAGKVMVTDASLIVANASLDGMQSRENSDPNFRNLKTYEQRYHDFKTGKKRKISNQTHISSTDPDATLVSRKTNYNKLCYKVHSTIDKKHRIIIDCHVTSGSNHECKIFPLVGLIIY